MRGTMRLSLFAGALLAGALAAPAAEADWRGRPGGWYGPARGYHPYAPRYHGPRTYGPGHGALGAIIGLGAGVAIGSALAAPPPPVYYAPPPVHYVPPPPPAYYYQPGPGYPPPTVNQGGVWLPMKPGW